MGSLLAYSPRGGGELGQSSRNVMLALKADKLEGSPAIATSVRIARAVKESLPTLPFRDYFGSDVTLVPTPKSSLSKPDTLWVPQCIARAMIDLGLGIEVREILRRASVVAKSAGNDPSLRPSPQMHYDSFAVQKLIHEPKVITLVDDVVTRGSTLLAAASRLNEAYPRVEIRAFAAMRTVSNPEELTRIRDPRLEVIRLRPGGDTLRRP